jgi:uncharacterized protein (TIGR02246 family)
MRPIWIIGAFATLSLATSVSAQQVDQNTRQQIERLAATYEERFDKQDAAGLAGLYARDGVLVSQAAQVVKTGPQEIEQNYQNAFKSGANHAAITVDRVSPLGADALISMGEAHITGQGQNGPIKADSHWTAVDVREGGTWKLRLVTVVPNPPPSTPTAR